MKSKSKRSFFRLLLENYIVFTVLIAIIVFLLFGAAFYLEGNQYEKINPSSIMKFSQALSHGEYESIHVERVLGKGGYIAVLDSTGKLVYQSDKSKPVPHYTASELELIQEYNGNKYLQTFEIETGEQKLFCVLTSEFIDSQFMTTNILIADNDLNIIFASPNTSKKKLTPNEYAILNAGYDSNYRITRFGFTDQNNNKLILLTYSPRGVEEAIFNKIDGIYASVSISFLLLYCVIIFAIIIWLNRKVKKPLNLLQGALNETANGNLKLKVDYQGPREFEEICNSFNHMSEKLYASEQARIRLESERRKLLADISHDLKTPITVIQGYAKALNDGIIPPEKYKQYLNTICVKADLLNELINTFHEYSKLEHPDYVLNLEPYDICNYLRDYMASKYNEMVLAGFELEVDIPETHIICSIDTLQLKRAFENIVTNFMRHNRAGVSLYCLLEPQADSVCITFADNGSGITAELAEILFDPFSVGEKSRNKGGSGLGLAISKKIILSHGGSINLVYPPKKNYKTQFQIKLPILQVNTDSPT